MASPTTNKFFWEAVISGFWKKHKPVEPELDRMNARFAVYYLRTFAQLTPEQFSTRLGVFPSVVTNWENRGGPFTRENLVRLKNIASSFDLVSTAEYFRSLEIAAEFRKSRRGKKFGPLDTLAGRT